MPTILSACAPMKSAGGTKRTVNVAVKRKRTFVKRDPQEEAAPVEEEEVVDEEGGEEAPEAPEASEGESEES